MADRRVTLLGLTGLAVCVLALGVTFVLQDFAAYPSSLATGSSSPFLWVAVIGVAFLLVFLLGLYYPRSWRAVVPSPILPPWMKGLSISLGVLFVAFDVVLAYVSTSGSSWGYVSAAETVLLFIFGVLLLGLGYFSRQKSEYDSE